jgi:capsular exopolysaccharide synthesis family protein
LKEITIKGIFAILRNRIPYLIIIPLAVLIAAVFILFNEPDYYTAETKLYVLMDYIDATGQIRYDTSASAQFAEDFKELLKTPQIIEAAENALGNTSNLKRDVTFAVSAVSGSRVLNITATSEDPVLSKLAVNTISQVFVDYIANITKMDAISIASEAVLPTSPSGPARLKTVITAYALAFLILSVFLVALEVFNTTFRTSEEVESKLGLPVLANIEDYRKKLKSLGKKRRDKPIISNYVSSITRENVKTLISNIEFASSGRPMQTLMITSSLSFEGKSSLCLLLSEAWANESYHVLLVDADFRKPRIGKFLGIQSKHDIIDYIYDHKKLEDIVMHTYHERVDFIDNIHAFVSTPNVFNYQRFRDLIEEAKQFYDIIVFDTPPLGLFIDAAILAGMVDNTLLIVGKGLTESDRVKDVVVQLQKANANLIGAVLNYSSLSKNSKYDSSRYYGMYDMDTK